MHLGLHRQIGRGERVLQRRLVVRGGLIVGGCNTNLELKDYAASLRRIETRAFDGSDNVLLRY